MSFEILKRTFRKNIKDRLRIYFSTAQVSAIIEGKITTVWRRYKQNFGLKRSKQLKLFLCKEPKILSLPSLSALILYRVMNVLKQKAIMSDCVLSFLQSPVAKGWSYDIATDNVYAPKQKVQCAA